MSATKKDKKRSKSKKQAKGSKSKQPTKAAKQVVVFDGNKMHNWVEMFEGCTLKDGSPIRVVQASWMEVDCTVYPSGCILAVAPIRESEGNCVRPSTLTVKPDFIIVRNQPRGPTPTQDKRNVLFSLMCANIPAINSLNSIYMQLERPIMIGALREISKRCGDKFPLIPLTHYASCNQMVIAPEFPCVMKVSHAHAGMGKVLMKEKQVFDDMRTVLALEDQYCSAEPYIDTAFGIRVQKVGPSYRAYKKVHTGSGWKSQFGGAGLETIEVTAEYKFWVDECAKAFGGLDILAVDAVVGKDGKHHIIELNGTAIGIQPKHWQEDSEVIRDMALDRLNDIFPPKQ